LVIRRSADGTGVLEGIGVSVGVPGIGVLAFVGVKVGNVGTRVGDVVAKGVGVLGLVEVGVKAGREVFVGLGVWVAAPGVRNVSNQAGLVRILASKG
jgi:hypothetical protein